MATDTKTRPTTFRTKYPELRLVREQRDDIFDSRGDRKIGQRNRDTVVAEQEQKNHELEVAMREGGASPEEVDRRLPDIDRTDWDVEFTREGTYETDDPKIIEWLRNHPGYNSMAGPAAFWEDGAAPDEPEPRLGDQMAAVAQAASTADLDALDEVERSERETHGRKSVLDAIDIARSNLQPVTEVAAEGETPSTLPPSEAA